MTKIEQLEAFRRYLQSSISMRSNRISHIIKEHKIRNISSTITKYTIQWHVDSQVIEKKLMAYIIEEQRKIYDYDMQIEVYRKNLERMEEDN